MRTVNTRHLVLGALIALAPLSFAHAQTPLAAPLAEYLFNGSGTSAQNSGSLPGQDLGMRDSSGTAANLYGAAGSGITGGATDFSFNNTGSTGMGNTGIGGRAQAGTAAFNALTSFTLTGWMKVAPGTAGGNSATLLDTLSTAGGVNSGFRLSTDGTGVISLNVNGNTSATSSGSATYASNGNWVFFAVTYDGSASSNNVKFYVGSTDESSAVRLNVTRTAAAGATGDVVVPLTIGNVYNWNARPFDGELDNIRIFGAGAGADGALSLQQIESVRLSDIAPIPEASSVSAVIGSAVVLMLVVRRLRKRG